MTRPGWIPRTCSECQKPFLASKKAQEQCSRLCRDRARNGARRLILARDSHTCAYCAVMARRDAKALRPNHLRIVKVNPQKKATAQNLATVCRRCAARWEGMRLPKDKEAVIVAQNQAYNEAAGIADSAVVEL